VPQHDPLPPRGESQFDYSRSYIFTSEEYVASFEAKASRKQALQEETRLRKVVANENKENRWLQKLEKAAKSKVRAEERAANKRYNDYWKKVKRDGWGDNLHNLIKASMRNPTPNLRTPQNLVVPNICRYNQKIALLHRRFKREGKDLRLVAPAMNVQQCLRDQCWNAHALHQGSEAPW
jgi:hypothetical protein